MAEWDLNLINSKYHLSIAKRMFNSFYDFREKRFLIGVINELAGSSSNLIKAYLIYENSFGRREKKNLDIFIKKVGPIYLDLENLRNILKALEIQKAQKDSKIEFAKGDKIILLVNGKYRFLTSERLKEFIDSVELGINKFPTHIKR